MIVAPRYLQVRIDFLRDPRIAAFASRAGYPGGIAEARGRLVGLWCHCLARGLEDAPDDGARYAVDDRVITDWLGAPGLIALLTDDTEDGPLGERRSDGRVDLAGTSETVRVLRAKSRGGQHDHHAFPKNRKVLATPPQAVNNSTPLVQVSATPPQAVNNSTPLVQVSATPPQAVNNSTPLVQVSGTLQQAVSIGIVEEVIGTKLPLRISGSEIPDLPPDPAREESRSIPSSKNLDRVEQAEVTSHQRSGATTPAASKDRTQGTGDVILNQSRVHARLRIWAYLRSTRDRVIRDLNLHARPLMAFDPGERDLAAYLRDATDLEHATADAMHAIDMAAIEARTRHGDVQWLTGAIFAPRMFRRLAGMTAQTAGTAVSSSTTRLATRALDRADPPTRKLPRIG